MDFEKIKITHNKLRDILIENGNEEYGDVIIDKICNLFGYPTTLVYYDEDEDYINNLVKEFNMDSNGYAYINQSNFDARNDFPCYIPENAETVEDVFSYKDLEKIVDEWLDKSDTREFINRTDTLDMSEKDWVLQLYSDLSWEYPSTVLENYVNNV